MLNFMSMVYFKGSQVGNFQIMNVFIPLKSFFTLANGNVMFCGIPSKSNCVTK